jgi:hypothetical protein
MFCGTMPVLAVTGTWLILQRFEMRTFYRVMKWEDDHELSVDKNMDMCDFA